MNELGAVPEGVLAMAGDALRRHRQAERRCMELLEGEGFEPVLLPVLEYDQGDQSRGYRFVEASGRVLAVRTDFTPLAMRVLGPALERMAGPVSVCYAGEVVRPGPASLRQLPELYQLGFERYGVGGGGVDAMDLAVRLAREVGVEPARCHVAVSVAKLAEELLARILEEPPGADLVELLCVRDLDAIVDTTGIGGATLAALERALYEGDDDGWSEQLGVAGTVARARPLLERCAALGVPCSLDVAARAVGDYYRGAMFAVWGERTHAVLAAGGEYEVRLASRRLPSVGACLNLSLALEEAAC